MKRGDILEGLFDGRDVTVDNMTYCNGDTYLGGESVEELDYTDALDFSLFQE